MGRATNGKNGTTRTSYFRPSKPMLKLSTVSNSPKKQIEGNKGNAEPGKSTSDRSQLNFPYDVRLGGFSSIHNAVTNGTPRIRRLLMEECDYIMECRICRNLFRSLPNFITHKLNYCKKVYDSTWSIGLSNLIQTSNTSYNIEYEVDPALLLDDNCSSNPNNTRSVSDLYSEIAMKAQKCSSSEQPPIPSKNENGIRLQLKPLVDVPGGSVVLQQQICSDPSNCDINSAHMNRVLTARPDTAILGPDGKVMCTGSSKGIEQIVSRLSAQMCELGEKQAQITNTTSITGGVCKSAFDSEKLIRQHQQEGLDCGRTYGSKLPAFVLPVSMKGSPMPENTSKSANSLFSQAAAPRQSLKTTQSPEKSKRKLSLSPVKRIKMKYSKLDFSGTIGEGKVERELSCSRCSSSFSTKHEMSMHLALCNGVINYAILKNPDSPKEKIRISVRNDFCKPKPTNSLFKEVKGNEVRDATRPLNNVRKMPALFASPDITNGIGSHTLKDQRQIKPAESNTSSATGSTELTEVNNNMQHKNTNPQSKSSTLLSKVAQSAEEPKLNGIVHEDDEDMDVRGDTDCSITPTSTMQRRNDCDLTKVSSVINFKKPVTPPRKKRKSNAADVGPVSTRLDRRNHISGDTFNLRRAISSRVRTSRRRHEHLDQPNSQMRLSKRKPQKLTRNCPITPTRKNGKTLLNSNGE